MLGDPCFCKEVSGDPLFINIDLGDPLKKTNHSIRSLECVGSDSRKGSTDSEVDVVAASDGLPSVYCTVTISRSSA